MILILSNALLDMDVQMADCQKWSLPRRVGCSVINNLRLVRSLISLHPVKSVGETFVQNYARRVFYAHADKIDVDFHKLEKLEFDFDCSTGHCPPNVRFKEELMDFLVGTIKNTGNSFLRMPLELTIENSIKQAINENIDRSLRPLFKPLPLCLNGHNKELSASLQHLDYE
jgi:hypothetical protein